MGKCRESIPEATIPGVFRWNLRSNHAAARTSSENGAAFDEESLFFYFMGGGHTDYGGNEVYEFDLKTGRWARLPNGAASSSPPSGPSLIPAAKTASPSSKPSAPHSTETPSSCQVSSTGVSNYLYSHPAPALRGH